MRSNPKILWQREARPIQTLRTGGRRDLFNPSVSFCFQSLQARTKEKNQHFISERLSQASTSVLAGRQTKLEIKTDLKAFLLKSAWHANRFTIPGTFPALQKVFPSGSRGQEVAGCKYLCPALTFYRFSADFTLNLVADQNLAGCCHRWIPINIIEI